MKSIIMHDSRISIHEIHEDPWIWIPNSMSCMTIHESDPRLWKNLEIQIQESIKCMRIINYGYQNPKESRIWILESVNFLRIIESGSHNTSKSMNLDPRIRGIRATQWIWIPECMQIHESSQAPPQPRGCLQKCLADAPHIPSEGFQIDLQMPPDARSSL